MWSILSSRMLRFTAANHNAIQMVEDICGRTDMSMEEIAAEMSAASNGYPHQLSPWWHEAKIRLRPQHFLTLVVAIAYSPIYLSILAVDKVRKKLDI